MKKSLFLLALLSAFGAPVMATPFVVGYVPPTNLGAIPPTAAPATSAAPRTPGLYVSVIDGAISLANKGGTSNFSAGQFGYVASPVIAPVVVPANPALKFTPPPAFTATVAASGLPGAPKSNSVDCEVR